MDVQKKHFRFRLDPRSKIFLMILISVSILAGESSNRNEYCKFLLIMIPIILLVLERHVKGAIIFFLLYMGINEAGLLFRYISEASLFGVSLRLLMGLIAGMGPCMIMGYYLISSTRVNEFICAMEKMHISKSIIIPFTVMFRFFPTIKEEYCSIRDAMRMRGIKFRWNLLAMLEYRFVPLIISTVKIGNELSAAALTRGLGSKIKRTNACTIGFGLSDMIFILSSVTISILYVVL